jgi:hypothetical protein
MAPDRSDPDQPAADDPLAGLRKLAGLAKDLGITDVASFTDALEAARNEGRGAELFKPLKAMVEQFAGQGDNNTKSLSDLGARLKSMVAGRENVVELRQRTEMALLRRIEELSGTAPIDGVLDLATAYARLCGATVTAGQEPPRTGKDGG